MYHNYKVITLGATRRQNMPRILLKNTSNKRYHTNTSRVLPQAITGLWEIARFCQAPLEAASVLVMYIYLRAYYKLHNSFQSEKHRKNWTPTAQLVRAYIIWTDMLNILLHFSIGCTVINASEGFQSLTQWGESALNVIEYCNYIFMSATKNRCHNHRTLPWSDYLLLGANYILKVQWRH